MDYLSPSTTRLRTNQETGVSLYIVREGELTEYQVYDYIYNEILNFPADQREEAIKTFEQMETRKV